MQDHSTPTDMAEVKAAINEQNPTTVTKKCIKCGREKTLDQFRRSKGGPCGRHGYCKPCHTAYRRQSYLDNRNNRISQAKKWNEANREKVREYKTLWAANKKAQNSQIS